MSNKNFHKSKIIYDRLYREYGKWDNLDQFAEEFGITRQQINNRKRSKTIDYDEIMSVFPEVNKDWLFSKDEIELKALPVKKSFTYDKRKENTIPYDDLKKSYGDRKAKQSPSRKERDLLIEHLQERAESLARDLRRLADLDRNRDSDS